MIPDDFVAYSCDKAGFLVWKPGLLTVPFWVSICAENFV